MKHHCNRDLFVSELNDLLNNPEIQRMAGYEQHQGNTTLQHVLNVAMVSFRIADRLGLDIDERALAKGAVLHDFYLYNIPETGLSDYRHGVSHPELAVRNAKKVMPLNKKEENIIRSHMWPLTLFHPPQSKEAVVVMMADKYCAVREMVFRKKTV
ncbi:MAG: HD domain-containing protein [Sarcina sp.]|nr:HD domain-containing protein [Sarcina sp.]HAL60429.1 HD family phosphohydrolase [Sarcina sp.]